MTSDIALSNADVCSMDLDALIAIGMESCSLLSFCSWCCVCSSARIGSSSTGIDATRSCSSSGLWLKSEEEAEELLEDTEEEEDDEHEWMNRTILEIHSLQVILVLDQLHPSGRSMMICCSISSSIIEWNLNLNLIYQPVTLWSPVKPVGEPVHSSHVHHHHHWSVVLPVWVHLHQQISI